MKSLSALLFLAGTLGAAPWSLEKLPSRWELVGFEESFDLSGIDSIDGIHCVVGADELFSIQPGTIDRAKKRITAGKPVPLMKPPAGTKKKPKVEIDIEGVAVDRAENRYFVTGSHGVGKKKGDHQPTRMTVFEVAVDPRTGRISKERIRKGSLAPWLERSPVFRGHVGEPLQRNGMNFEGLTFAHGKLWFGTRGPNIGGKTHVIEVEPESLFSDGIPRAKAHALTVGEGRGIRALASVGGGFLVVTGNSAAEATPQIPVSDAKRPDATFDLYHWQPGHDAKRIGRLPEAPGKAEALLVLDETPDHIDTLILYDSAPGGGPRSIRIHKR